MDVLPDEMLATIIRLLPWRERLSKIERVSKRWNRVARKSGWSNFTVFDSGKLGDDSTEKVS